MVRLSWIAFELGSATGLPRKNIIPQKRQLDEGPKFWLDVSHYPPHSIPLLLPDGILFAELVQLPYCRPTGSYPEGASGKLRRRFPFAADPFPAFLV
jgi:hypothetical protein